MNLSDFEKGWLKGWVEGSNYQISIMNTPPPLQLTDRESESEVESDEDGYYTSEDIERCYSLADCETDASRNA